MMRRLFVSVATLPSVLGVVRLEAMRIGWIDDPTSASLLILVITLAFVFLIGRYARRLEAAEQARIDAEAEKERAELLVAVQRMQAIRADRLRALGEMATAVAHELNQPLFGVRGAAEHLLLGLDRGWDATDEKIRNRLKQILDQSDRMTHIIQHIRRFGRRDDSETPETVRISDVLVSTVDLLETQLRLHGINLNVESDNRAPPVRINRYALEEVMINLVINARDAVEERRERERNFTGRITLRVYASERGVVLEIRDNGPGIAEEHMNRIFEPFFTTKAPDTGTGLGLPICRMLIEEAGGTIEVLSTPGDGVVVRVTLSSAEVI
jgi:C4-dicarboxylate-specific signal transduction histidine kinase